MSVLVKGMEIPTSCMTCLFQTPYMGGWCFLLNDNSNAYSRRRDCPLVLVPPHGDLIDRDALDMNYLHIRDDGMKIYTQRAIDNAPTIIPAEEGET